MQLIIDLFHRTAGVSVETQTGEVGSEEIGSEKMTIKTVIYV